MLVRDAANFQTNSRFLFFAGSIYDGTWKSISVAGVRLAFVTLGVIQLSMKILLRDGNESPLMIIEALHWLLLFVTVIPMLINCLIQSSRFLKAEMTIKAGFFEYGGNLTEEQIKTRAEANKDVKLSTLMFSSCCAFMLVANYIKAPLLMSKWSLPYPMWMPFEINSWFRYSVAMVWTWFSPESMVFNGCSNWVAYVTMAKHLIAQFQILVLAVHEMDSLSEQEGSEEERERQMLERVKECVQHHLILIKFFGEFQKYFDVSLAVVALNTGLIFCALGYVITSAALKKGGRNRKDNLVQPGGLIKQATSPDTPLAFVAPLLLVVIPELWFVGFYCLLGQTIADVAEDVGSAVYNIKWYTMPLSVQRDLLMMLVGCKKVRQLTAMGLHEFSKKGFSELLQAAFKYFNILNALS